MTKKKIIIPLILAFALLFVCSANAENLIIKNISVFNQSIFNNLTVFGNFTINPDTTPPIISNVQATQITQNSANISWDTDEASYFNTVEYGLDVNYGTDISQSYNTNLTNRMIPKPSILLTNLNEFTTYHYRVKSCDLFSNCAYSGDYNFTTTQKENHAPIFIGIPVIPYMYSGNAYIFKVQVYDSDGDPVTIKWFLNSELMSTTYKENLTSSSGVTDEYNFTASSAGVYNFKIIVSDRESSNYIEFNANVAASASSGGGGGGARPDTTPPEAIIRYNSLTKNIEVLGIDNSGKNPNISYQEKCLDKKCQNKLITYNIQDDSKNTLILKLNYERTKNQVSAKVLSMDYIKNSASLASMQKFRIAGNIFSVTQINSPVSLNQDIYVKGQFNLNAGYNKKRNETKIKIIENKTIKKYSEKGLVFAELSTDNGKLNYNFRNQSR